MSLKTLLFFAPFSDIDSPYASTAYLSGFLRDRGHDSAQADLSIELFTRLLSRDGLGRARDFLNRKYRSRKCPKELRYFIDHADELIPCTEAALRLLQTKDPVLGKRLASESFFPSIPGVSDSWWANEQIIATAKGPDCKDIYGLEPLDRARYFATRHLYCMVSVLAREPSFRLDLMLYPTIKGYQEFKLDIVTFDALEKKLKAAPSVVDEILEELVEKHYSAAKPDLVGISVPLTSTAYGAFRIAKKIRKLNPGAKIVLGGGFCSTELRGLADPRIFKYTDYIVLDDGEKPLERILEHVQGKISAEGLLRTFVLENGRVVLKSDPTQHDVPRRACGTPYFADLPYDEYVPTMDHFYPSSTKNFQNFRMNKMTLAQGCYWKRCTFCDVSLAYIDRYDPSSADVLIDQIEKIIEQTGEHGFHFTDEAMPPMLLRGLCERIIQRGVRIHWQGMMRFDKAFDSDLPELMKKAGCIAALCGLEVASERMLKDVVDKGITLEQVAQVAHRLSEAGLMVHTYLMYGYPMQKNQDTIDSLEFVRQIFAAGIVHSAVWSRFSLTMHSPVGLNPEKYGIRVLPESSKPPKNRRFCKNALRFVDPAAEYTPDQVEAGLTRALRLYMHGLGFERDVCDWFAGMNFPKPSIPADFVKTAIEKKRIRIAAASEPLQPKYGA